MWRCCCSFPYNMHSCQLNVMYPNQIERVDFGHTHTRTQNESAQPDITLFVLTLCCRSGQPHTHTTHETISLIIQTPAICVRLHTLCEYLVVSKLNLNGRCRSRTFTQLDEPIGFAFFTIYVDKLGCQSTILYG